jgi:DNA mismatch repair protein MutL
MIRILDAATVGRIAAGEVVERPSSVAKELVENALDAGATSVTVEIRDGGESYLRVTDNGCGIQPSEVRMAFENHATSKLRDDDDLTDIRTLGFRGEALPSIAAVARVEMTTRVKNAASGVKIQIEGGRFLALEEAGCPEGTTIIARDLFFNTPARQGFLKKPAYEAGVVGEMIEKLALANPKVALRLISNGRTLLHSYGDDSMLHAALAVYGRETAAMLRPIDTAIGGLHLWGLIGVGDAARQNRSGQSFFINGRVVRCPLLTQALESACRGRLTIGMYPMCALHLDLPPAVIDVNVHPSKLEIRFRDEALIRESAASLFEKFFESDRMTDAAPPPLPESKPRIEYTPPAKVEQTEVQIPVVKPAPKPPEASEKQPEASKKKTEVLEIRPTIPEKPSVVYDSAILGALRPVMRESGILDREKWVEETAPVEASKPPVEPVAVEAPQSSQKPVVEYRLIGVFKNTYLLLEQADAMIMIDQHAAHERILYEKFKRMLEQGTASQQLLTPLVVRVTARERAVLMDNLDTLSQAGFEVEPFGERDLMVRAVPFVLSHASLNPFFMEMVEQLDRLKSATMDRRRGEIIQLSCKRAVKAGDRLSDAEIQALLDEMARTSAPPTCPHGRPVMRVFRLGEMERMFKRQQ